jgi:hypothetical protein
VSGPAAHVPSSVLTAAADAADAAVAFAEAAVAFAEAAVGAARACGVRESAAIAKAAAVKNSAL